VPTLKNAFGLIRALVPIIYCGSLLYYFLDIGGSVEGVETIGLGPTVLGLGVVGLLFCIPLIIKIMRILSGPRLPGSGGGRDPSPSDDESGADADAAIARYKARQSAPAVSNAPPNAPIVSPARPIVSPAHKSGGPAVRSGFGRRIG